MFRGRAPLSVALSYINRLPHEPWSVWRAKKLGGLEHLGWSIDTYKTTELIDSTNLLISVMGHRGKGSVKAPPPSPRPKRVDAHKAVPETESLENFDINQLVVMTGASIGR